MPYIEETTRAYLLDLDGNQHTDEFFSLRVHEGPFYIQTESRVELLDIEALRVCDCGARFHGARDSGALASIVVVQGVGHRDSRDDSVGLDGDFVSIHL